jgi:hypothetical protein
MVQIIEHRTETSVDFAVEGEAASSTPQVPNRPVPGTAAVHAARQHTATQTSRTPSRASPGALSAARELLRHPPSSTASPGGGGHEAMVGRRRPTTRYGTFYLNQVEDTVIPAPTRGVSICALTLSKGCTDQRPPGRTQLQARGRGCPSLFGKGARAPPKHRWSQPRSRLRCGCTAYTNGHPVPNGCPLGRCGLRRSCGSSLHGVMATQVPAAPAGKVRQNIEPVEVPVGVRHRNHDSRWEHRCDGDIFPCGLVWTSPDLAHEPHPRISLLLGGALRAVRCELRQRLPATRCGVPPPCGETGAWGDSPEVHLPLHQGARYHTPHF